MREQSDEYFCGKGKQPSEFLKGDADVMCDMSSTFVDEDGYKLGNVIPIETILEESDKMLSKVTPIVEAKMHEPLDEQQNPVKF